MSLCSLKKWKKYFFLNVSLIGKNRHRIGKKGGFFDCGYFRGNGAEIQPCLLIQILVNSTRVFLVAKYLHGFMVWLINSMDPTTWLIQASLCKIQGLFKDF